MGVESLILISNPGSQSRKYALYRGKDYLASIHFEHEGSRIVYTVETGSKVTGPHKSGLHHLAFAPTKVWEILEQEAGIKNKYDISAVAIRIVAPSTFFQTHRALDGAALKKLKALEKYARLHVHASIQEIELLGGAFPRAQLVGVSDSAFHSAKPEHSSYYAIPAKDAANLDIKRFGYHGLSAESVTSQLKQAKLLPPRLVIAHLGSGLSIMAVKNGKSYDSTMGYSPLEGPIMSTRSGSIDPTAAGALKQGLGLDEDELQDYLNHKSGLLGVSGVSSDVRELLLLEKESHKPAKLALKMYVYRVQQGIGQMAAVLGGIDGLVFTGTVGERSAVVRGRVASGLMYLGLAVDPHANHSAGSLQPVADISPSKHPAKIYVVHANEANQMATAALELI